MVYVGVQRDRGGQVGTSGVGLRGRGRKAEGGIDGPISLWLLDIQDGFVGLSVH